MNFWQLPPSLFGKKKNIFIGSVSDDKTAAAKQRLTRFLLELLQPQLKLKEEDVKIKKDTYGCPGLPLEDSTISFSHCGDLLWAAVGKSVQLGIDVATPLEFIGNYPFHRVFQANEMSLMQQLCQSKTNSAAFLWTCKEAVAKVLGTGFTTIEPIDIRVTSYTPCQWGYMVEVQTKKQHRVAISPLQNHWIAVAV